jgi:phosphoribosylformylglycinamidine cyclo-ligase
MVSATDGAGTKTLVADAVGRYDTIGIDVVAMCVDDIVCLGAEPLFFLDLITVGRLDGDRIEALVSGLAAGCRQAGCALVGGEIAEHPDALAAEQWDVGGFAVGVVERRGVIDGPRHVAVGDAVVGLASTGLRCNGYSLARRLLLDDPDWHEELLRPSVIYAPAVLDLVRNDEVHAVAHITGGGLPGNLCRVLPSDADAVLRRGSWDVPAVFDRSSGGATSPTTRWPRSSTWASGWPSWCRQRQPMWRWRGWSATATPPR